MNVTERAESSVDAFLHPRSIAIIGASDDPGRVGGMPLRFLREVRYSGDVYAVNPSRSLVQGETAYASILDIDDEVDLAIIAVSSDRVLESVEQCAAAGVRAVVIFSSGFAEIGGEGEVRQHNLLKIANRTGVRILGPNCAGVMNVRDRVTASFGSHLAADQTLLPGSIAIVSQSGAVGAYLFTLARRRGVGLSYWVTTGNEANTTLADFIDGLAEDEHTAVIALYIEQVADGEKFARACRRALENGKLIVGILAGRTPAAEEALLSHTAALAGDREITAAALSEFGVVLVDRMDELLAASIAMAAPRIPGGRGVGLVTVSGAAGILMVDYCSKFGLRVPKIPSDTQAEMRSILTFAGTSNPVDLTGSVSNSPHIFGPFIESVLSVEEIDVVVVFLGHVLLSPHVGSLLLDNLIAIQLISNKPLWLVGTVQGPEDEARLASAGIPLFVDPCEAIQALSFTIDAAARRTPQSTSAYDMRRDQIDKLSIDIAAEREFLSESEAQGVLEGWNIRFPSQTLATSADEANAFAMRMPGARYALKIASPDIAHKTEIGGVLLNIDAKRVGESWQEIESTVRTNAPLALIEGVLIQEMIEGVLVIVGTRNDATFGPIVLVGSGGIYTEFIHDRAMALAPVSSQVARRLIDETLVGRLLSGVRGGPELALGALVDVIVGISQLAWAARDRVAVLELNPVVVRRYDAVAVDALIETIGGTHGI
jgi:acyl-CoA synthetase (NDP forming)